MGGWVEGKRVSELEENIVSMLVSAWGGEKVTESF